jgi:DNA-binding NarL/FixJ family response regulator
MSTGETVVLWISRHPVLPAQTEELRRKLGDISIVHYNKNVASAEEVVELAKKYNAKIVIPILPLSFLAKLAEEARKNSLIVLLSKMNTVKTTRDLREATRLIDEAPDKRTVSTMADGTLKVVEFQKFEKLIAVEVITEPWDGRIT